MKYLILLLLPFSVMADRYAFDFVPPNQREDGGALASTEIAEYKVLANGKVKKTIPATANSFTLWLTVGTYDVTMKTVDTDGLRSKESNVVRTIVNPLPNPPVLQ